MNKETTKDIIFYAPVVLAIAGLLFFFIAFFSKPVTNEEKQAQTRNGFIGFVGVLIGIIWMVINTNKK